MQTSTNPIAIVVTANQNLVSKAALEKIRRAVKAEFPNRKTKIFANDNIGYMLSKTSGKYDRIVYHTKIVSYEVWAEVNHYLSALHPDKETIVLN